MKTLASETSVYYEDKLLDPTIGLKWYRRNKHKQSLLTHVCEHIDSYSNCVKFSHIHMYWK